MTEAATENVDAVAGNAREFFSALDRLRQGQRMFQEGHENVLRLRQNAVESFNSLFENSDAVHIRISPFDFHVGEHSIYNDGDPQTSLAYRFHQDGVKEFVFHTGITEEEFLKFVDVCAADFSDPRFEGYDTASLMWEYEFQNIAYVAVESFSGYDDNEEAEGEQSNHSEMRIVSSVDDFISKILPEGLEGDTAKIDIRISAEDLQLLEDGDDRLQEVDMQEVDDPHEVDIEIPASARQQLLETLDQESGQLPRRRLYILVELMQETTDQEMYDRFLQRFQSTLLEGIGGGDFSLVADVLGGAEQLVNEALGHSLGKQLATTLCHDDAYDLFTRIAASKDKESATAMAKLLGVMPADGLMPLIRKFAQLEDPKMRVNWVGWVLRHPKLDRNALPELIQEFDTEFAQSLLKVLGAKTSLQAVRSIVLFAEHPEARVRAAALDGTSKSNLPEAKLMRRKCLDDANSNVRGRALRYIQGMRDQNAAGWLKDKLDDDEFLSHDLDEAEKYLLAYAAIDPENAMLFSKALLSRQGGFLGKKAEPFHQLAIKGLTSVSTADAARQLVEIVKSGKYSKSVRKAAEEAAQLLKSRLVRKAKSNE